MRAIWYICLSISILVWLMLTAKLNLGSLVWEIVYAKFMIGGPLIHFVLPVGNYKNVHIRCSKYGFFFKFPSVA